MLRRRDNSNLQTLNTLQERAASHLDSRVSTVQSRFWASIFRHIPYPLQRVLPFVRGDIKQLVQDWKTRKSPQPTAAADAPTPGLDKEPHPPADRPDQPSPYPRYACVEHPLTCSQARHALTTEGEIRRCQQCGFPGLLQENSEIRGQRGRYRVGSFLGSRGLGRLYEGQDINRRRPIVIREYLLPLQQFNPTEQRLTRDTFETIAGLKLADGRQQDFRIMQPWDAMGDRHDPERCYLVTTGSVDTYPTCDLCWLSQEA